MPATKISEEELIQLLCQRSEEGYQYLYDHYSAALYGVALKIVLQEDAASDVLQDTIITIWKQIESYNPSKGRIFTWMMNICRNKGLDYLRSKHVKYKIHNPEAIVYYEENESTSQKVDQIGLREIVEKLPVDLRHALEIVYFGGYTHEEAAEELGIPLGTLKSRVRLALKNIRELLKRDISES